LAPGGTLALTTLNRRSLAWMVFGTKWSMIVEDHFTYWDRRSLRGLLERHGLSVVSLRTFGLGRDFVKFMDGPSSSSEGGRVADREEKGSRWRWDVRSEVLTVEEWFNAAFRLCGGGVGLEAIARRVG
jgi:hypothetical protein